MIPEQIREAESDPVHIKRVSKNAVWRPELFPLAAFTLVFLPRTLILITTSAPLAKRPKLSADHVQ